LNAYKFSKAQIKIDELIEPGNIKDAEQCLIQLEEKLAQDNSQEELNSLKHIGRKLERSKKIHQTFLLPNKQITSFYLLW
jgi:hypothetical protein|tara:strand:- start:2018 stop:2257 length:240 start_codon:yes stop_codon:yes gene_type:complete